MLYGVLRTVICTDGGETMAHGSANRIRMLMSTSMNRENYTTVAVECFVINRSVTSFLLLHLGFCLIVVFKYPIGYCPHLQPPHRFHTNLSNMSFVEVNNHKLHYADSHPQGAPEKGLTFVFVHGLGSSQNFYFPVIPYLTSNHRCITLDTYGSGRSEYTGQPISIESIAKDVIAVMDKFTIEQAVVVGHSMGGLVVTLLGAQYADRLKGVIAIGPTHPSETLVSVMTKRAETVSSCMSP